jgi:hypothetical protein
MKMTNSQRDIPLGVFFLVISAYCVFATSQHLGILQEPAKIALMIFGINLYNYLFNKSLKKMFPSLEKKLDEQK